MTQNTLFPPEFIQAYLAGRLDREEAERLEEAAVQDASLAAEIAMWRGSRAVHEETVANSAPGAFGWARIERAIRTSSRAPANDAGSVRPFWTRPMFAPWQAAAALAAGVFAWQVAIVPTVSTAQLEDNYALAGSDQAGPASAKFTVRVAFVETATEGDIRTLLDEVEARIVDGPTAIGFYTLSFADADALAKARGRLAASGTVIAEVTD